MSKGSPSLASSKTTFLNYTETLKKKCFPYFNVILISGQNVSPKEIVSESLIRISAKKGRCKDTN